MARKDWNALDKLIARFRYVQVNKYITKGSVIVDIGCGREGEFLLHNKDIISKGFGFDYRIKDHAIDNINLINNKKLKKLPLDDNSVDTVFLNAVLEHLETPEKVLTDALRVLKKNGKIVMTTPTPISKPILEFMAFKIHIINEDEILDHKHYYNQKDIKNLVKELNKTYKVKLLKYKKFELGVNSLIVLEKIK